LERKVGKGGGGGRKGGANEEWGMGEKRRVGRGVSRGWRRKLARGGLGMGRGVVEGGGVCGEGGERAGGRREQKKKEGGGGWGGGGGREDRKEEGKMKGGEGKRG